MQWLMGEPPMAVSGRIVCDERGVDEVAEMELRFGSGRTARANLSWRATARRTSAVITGERGALEIENDRIILIDGCGNRSAMPVSDIPDDSYHSSWFSGIASLFIEAVTRGSDSEPAITNLDEARNALISIISARHSAKNDGVAVTISA
jgi:predicted dehydrogenase